jgi:predicted metalloendopeptidase
MRGCAGGVARSDYRGAKPAPPACPRGPAHVLLDTRASARILDSMAQDLETLQEQAAQLSTAIQALTSLTRTPQERLDRAISYFSRTFRDEPTGSAHAAWRRIYEAIGDPPVGTTLAVRIDTLKPEEREAISQALFELHAEIQRTCWEAERTAAAAATTGA